MAARLLQPDRTLASPLQSKAYYNGAGGVDIKDANVKDFYVYQKFSAKDFNTKQFSAKDFWKGDFQFSTKPAIVKTDSASGKTFGTKSHPIKDAREAGKGFDTSTFATREAPVKGKTSQNHLDEVNKGQTQMNIDQVRDLLNKPKL